MRSPDQPKPSRCLQAILERKFGSLLSWQVPKIEKTVGPYQPEVFLNYGAKRDALVLKARDVLSNYSDQDILILCDEQMPDSEDLRQGWNDFLRFEVSSLQSRKPRWFQGGFGHPDYVADFEYWGQMERFSLHEALLLSIGVDPEHLKEDWVWGAKKRMKQERLIAPIEYLVKRHEQFLRKYPRGPSTFANASPNFLWQWFEEVGMEIHEGFRVALRRRVMPRETEVVQPKQTDRPDSESGKPDPREVDKIAQLFAAMAIDQLGYRPDAQRSPVPKEIADLAASMGLSISDDTVRKYLRRGAAFIPQGWKSE